ncbi:hypothetical protein DFH09DRAFT_333775 [Mycena vulgaris]|nr:hypothetical protein DFH09DRAFT_333775 [Mycena vulgaris]
MESQDGHHFQSHLDNALDRRNETQPSSDFSLPNTHFNGFFGNDPDPLEESSALKIATPCVKDDQVFIHNVAAGKTIADTEVTIEGGERIALVWSALESLPVDAIRKRVFLQLLRGCDEEDIWLWIDGDEKAVGDASCSDPPPWKTAAVALRTRLARQPRSTPLRDRVQSVVPEMRVAMILWLVLTSKAYKDAAKEGILDLEEWNLELLVDIWWSLVPIRVWHWLREDNEDHDYRKFDAVMAAQGHNCVPKYCTSFNSWLLMRSELFPAQKYNVPAGLKSAACNACLARQPPEHPPPPPWTPSLVIVALRFMWDATVDHDNFCNWLEQQPLSGIRQVNEALLKLRGDDPSSNYLPWVNEYPFSDFRDTVVKYTLNEWRSMEDCALWPELERPSFHVRAWVAAMAWSMLGTTKTNGAEHVDAFVEHLYDDSCLFDFFEHLPPPTRSDSFRDAVAKSGHTCWQKYDDDVMDTYASAMEFFGRKPTVVAVDSIWRNDCPICQDRGAFQKMYPFSVVDNETFVKSLGLLAESLERESRRRGLRLSLQVRDIATQPNQPAYEDTFPVPRDQQSTAFQVQVVPTTSGPPDPDIHARPIVDSNVSEHLPAPQQLEHHLGLQYSTSNARDDIPQTVTAHVDPPWDSHEAPGNQSEIPEYPMGHSHPSSYYYQSVPQVSDYDTDAQRWTIDHDSAREKPLRRDSTVVEAVYYQGPGPRSTPLSISDPTGGRVVTEAAVTLAPAYESPPLNLVAESSVSLPRRVPTQDGESELCKDDMIKHLKIFFTESFERLGVELHGSKRIKKLPWLQFDETLEKEGIEMVNWPGDVPTPGKGPNSSKGLAGLPVRHLNKIYAAIHRETAKLQLQRIPGARKPGQAVSQQEFFGDDSAVASSSRKRGRDREDEGDTRPKKKQLEGVSRFRIDLMRRSD